MSDKAVGLTARFFDLLANLKRHRHAAPRVPRRRFVFESLESRLLLSADLLPVEVVGTAGNDTVIVTAIDADSGSYSINGGAPIAFNDIVLFSFEGFDGNDLLQINGTGGADTIVHTPGAANDAGKLLVNSLAVNYQNLGAGSLTIDALAGANTVTVNGTAGNDNTAATDIDVVRGAATTTVQVAAFKTVTLNSPNTTALIVDAGLGSDIVNVTGAGAAGSLTVLGGGPDASGGGADRLVVNTVAGTTTVSPGSTPDAGVVDFPAANPADDVAFTGMEFLTVNGAGAGALVMQGTQGNDTMTVQNLGGNNLVWINDRAVTTFTAFSTLTLQGRFGDDTINVSPVGPVLTGVTTVNADGGDPTGSDTVTVNGSTGADTFNVTINASNSATVLVGGVTVQVTTTEHLRLDGRQDFDVQNGLFDTINYFGDVSGANRIVFTPGDSPDAGTLIGFDSVGGLPTFIPVEFAHIARGAAATQLNIDSNGSGALVIRGTEGNDTVSVNATGVIALTTPNAGAHVLIDGANFQTLELDTLAGDDSFTISGGHPYTTINVLGGDPSASDVVNFNGSGGNIVVDLAAGTVQEGANGAVSLSGVEVLNVNGNGGNIAINGASNPDQISVSPTGANTARVTVAGSNLTINTDSTGSLTIDALAGANTVTVNGTAGNDNTAATDIDVVRGAATTTVQVATFKTVTLNSPNTTALIVDAGLGSDIVNVTGAGAAGSLTVLGGGPDASGGGADRLVVNTVAGTTTVSPGSTPDAGVVDFPAANPADDVAFTGMEFLTVNGAGAGTLVMQGTQGNDTMTVQNLGGNNLVWINDRAVTTFTAFSTLTLQGRFGDDTINVSPVGPVLTGVTTVNADGGDPTGSDTVTVNGSTGADTFSVTINASNSATVLVGGITVQVTTTEHLRLDGRQDSDLQNGLFDTINYFGDVSGFNRIVFTPGDSPDAGTLIGFDSVGGLPTFIPVEFAHIARGAAATQLNIDSNGSGALVIRGTEGNDTASVNATGVIALTTPNAGAHVLIAGANFQTLELDTLGGDDSFTINGGHPYPIINVLGGDPSASDTLNYTATANANTTIDLSAGSITSTGANTIVFAGIERVNETSSGATSTLTVIGTAGDDTINVTPTAAGAGSFTALPGVQFTYAGVGGAFTVTGGSAGFDVLSILGNESPNTFTSTVDSVTVSGGTVTAGAGLDRLDILALGGNDSVNLGAFTALPTQISGGDGDDTLIGSPQIDQIDGGRGNDTINGGAGNDLLLGGDGNDVLDGDLGADQAFGGDGSDTFVWDPGDGSDLLEGDQGNDVLRFNGAVASEVFTLNAVGTRFQLLRNIGGIVMDVGGVEQVNLNALGGGDAVTVNDLFGTDILTVNLDLGALDLAVDAVTVMGRATADNLTAALAGATITVQGLTYNVNVTSAEATTDTLTINGNDGNDSIQGAAGLAAAIRLTLNGNAGNDSLSADATLNGNEGDDLLVGGPGNNTMDGGEGDDTFVGNGGTDAIGGGAGSSVGDTIFVSGTAGNDAISLSLTVAGHLVATLNGVTTTYTNFIGGPIAASGIEQIRVQALAGADTLTVDSTNGAIPIGINFDGGDGADSLTLTGGTATSDIYSAGPNPGSGSSTIVIGGVIQLVNFTNLEPVFDNVLGPLTVLGSNADNSINYRQGSAADRGLVSVDDQETIDFKNKTTLTIDALAGHDSITLNNPNTPTGLAGITVNGGDPTAGGGDTLIVNGRPGVLDDMFVTPTAVGAGTVAGVGVQVTFSGTEQLNIAGQAADRDILRTVGTAGSDTYEVTPGAVPDAGAITGFRADGGGFAFTPIAFSGIAGFIGPGVGFTNADTAIINGTAADDTIRFSQSTSIPGFRSAQVNNQTEIFFDFPTIVLRGLAGNDTFNLSFTPGDGRSIRIEGGDGADTLNHTSNANANTTIDLSAGSITSTSANPIVFAGIERVNQTSSGATSTLTVIGTAGDDTINVTPTAAGAGSFTAQPGVQFTYAGVGGAFTVTGGSAGFDVLSILGNEGPNTFTSTVDSVTVSGGTVTAGAGLDRLDILALGGNDSVNLGAFTALPTQISGGDGDDTLIGSPQIDQIDGGRGNDTINGGAGNDLLLGAEGNDVLDGDLGADQAFGGDGSDTFVWDPGDGSDLLEGDQGGDVLRFNGAVASEVFTLNAVGTRFQLLRNIGGIVMDVGGVEQVNLNALGGVDAVTVNDLFGTDILTVNLDLGALDLAADAVTVTGRATADNLTAALAGATITVQGLTYNVNVTSAEATTDTLTINGNDGNDSIQGVAGLAAAIRLTLNGNAGNDSLSADATLNGNEGDDLLVGGPGNNTMDGGEGDDTFVGNGGTDAIGGGAGSSVGDTIFVSGTAGNDAISLSLTVAGHLVATLNGVTTTYKNFIGGPIAASGIEQIRVQALAGADTLTVDSTNGAIPIGINFDGGDPIGVLPGDSINIVSPDPVTFFPGPQSDEGGFTAGGNLVVSFDHVETIAVGGGGPLLVGGANGNDAFTVIARDSSTHAGADGVRDFTLAVNNSIEFLFINTPTLSLNGLGGDDAFLVRALAPNNAAWNVAVTINGGASSAGDRLTVETPGAALETATFTPAAFDAGTLNIVTGPSLVSDITMIELETFLYDGKADGDTLAIVGSGGADNFVHNAGAANDEGSVRINSKLAAGYQNLGSGEIRLTGGAGSDSLTYAGTAGNDSFTIDSVGGQGKVVLNARVSVYAGSIEALTLEGSSGDDTFTLVPALSASPFAVLNLNGGSGSPLGDRAILVGASGADSFLLSGQTAQLGGVIVNGSDLEDIRIDTLLGDDVLTYSGVAGVSEAINVTGSVVAGAGKITVPGVAGFTFAGTEYIDVIGNTGAFGDTDTVAFTGTNNADNVFVHLAAAGASADPIVTLQDSAGLTLLKLRNYVNFSTLGLYTLDGNDVINVYTGPVFNRNLFVNGGQPTAKKSAVDRLNVYFVRPRPRITQSTAQQNPGSGTVTLDYQVSTSTIQYTDIEGVVVRQE